MESSIDSPAIALFNQPAAGPQHKASPRHFVLRSLHNIRQGNLALLVVFCGCLIIFVRALFGVGYDEGFSAQADAASAKHPSLLARWGSQPQHAIEAQWKKLRERRAVGSSSTAAGLWAKIRKEDEDATSSATAQVPGAGALHWLRVMEDKAMAGLGRKPRPDTHDHDLEDEHDDVAFHEAAGQVQVPVNIPEHDISEDLDEHDGHDEDEHHHHHPQGHQHQDHPEHADSHNAPPDSKGAAPPVASDAADKVDHRNAPSTPEGAAPPPSSSSSSVVVEAPPSDKPAAAPTRDPEHDDTDDEPVYKRDEHR